MFTMNVMNMKRFNDEGIVIQIIFTSKIDKNQGKDKVR